ncbi:MAG: TonB-dependent receptor [Methyloglobulus sp.]|nr:TonB-dependent receptor [Methyloglobulus sp.]
MLSFTQPLSAQETKQVYELPLDQLVNVEVVSASRFKQKSSEAPSAVEVLTAENIRSYGWRTLADALNSIRGLYTRNDRNYSYLGNRGFSRAGDYNARALIMIDGRRMNETIFDSVGIGEEFMLDMNLIERIEYIPGSGSSVYGANALLGVVNIITKRGKDLDGVRLGGEVGSLGMYRGRATFGKQWDNGAELLLSGSRYYSHGNDQLFFPEFSKINGGIAQDMDQERNSRAFGKLSYGDLTLRGGYVSRYKRVPTASFGAIFNDKDYFGVDNVGYVDLDYLTQINANLGLEVRGFHHWYDYYAITPYDANEGIPPLERILNFEGSDARWWGGEAKLTGTQIDHHKWIAGVEVQYDQHQHYIGYDISPPNPGFNVYSSGWRVGAYFQDEFRITKSLLLNAGLRLDHHHLLDSLQLNPRIGLIWDVTPAFTTKLLYGSAFRAPNVLEYSFNATSAKLPREELIKSYEAVAEWYPGEGFKLLGTVFYNDMTKVLTAEPDTYDPDKENFVNTGKFRTLGFELGAEKLWDNGRQLKLTWTHNNTRDETLNGGSWATDSPKNLVKAHYAEPLLNDKLRLGFEEIFVDERRTLSNKLAPSYHLFNINLALTKPIYGFQASLGIYNVFDQHFKVVGGPEHVDQGQDTLTMDGRTVRFRLEHGL